MAYADEYAKLVSTKFGTSLQSFAGQEVSKLERFAQVQPCRRNQECTFDYAGDAVVEELNSDFNPIDPNELPKERRIVVPRRYKVDQGIGDLSESRQPHMMAPVVAQKIIQALQVKKDKIIIDALKGNATVHNSSTSADTSIALPSTQKVAKDYGGSDSSLIINKILKARSLIEEHDGDAEGELILAYETVQHYDLLETDRAVLGSSDFGSQQLLMPEKLKSLGITPVRIAKRAKGKDRSTSGELILPGAGTTGDPAMCYLFKRGAVGLGVNLDVKGDMFEAKNLHGDYLAYGLMDLAALRLLETSVVEIACVYNINL